MRKTSAPSCPTRYSDEARTATAPGRAVRRRAGCDARANAARRRHSDGERDGDEHDAVRGIGARQPFDRRALQRRRRRARPATARGRAIGHSEQPAAAQDAEDAEQAGADQQHRAGFRRRRTRHRPTRGTPPEPPPDRSRRRRPAVRRRRTERAAEPHARGTDRLAPDRRHPRVVPPDVEPPGVVPPDPEGGSAANVPAGGPSPDVGAAGADGACSPLDDVG